MTQRHLPSVEALTSNDDDLLFSELRLSDIHEKVALARALLDEVERLVPAPSETDPLALRGESAGGEEVVAELARVGCSIVEIAKEISRAGSPRLRERGPGPRRVPTRRTATISLVR